MRIEYNKSLKKYNTFGIDAIASEFTSIKSELDLNNLLAKNNTKPIFVLSGGSNMLLTKNLDYLVIHIAIKGIEIIEESSDFVVVSVNAGEKWHDFVKYCIKNNFGGLENLSLIPGYVGSAPIQNIGAYGVELKDTMTHCEAIHITTREKHVFLNKDCKFGYRNSIFKEEAKGKYIITKVIFRLTKKNHILNTNYGAIENALLNKKITQPTIKDISEAVIKIRQSKLPDPALIGNSGSFFKNPVITTHHFLKIQEKYPNIPSYKIDQEHIKVPAGWLIEQSGFKGKRWGDAGIHEKQALVLVNYNNASGKEILNLSKKIQTEIKEKFNIILETEVNII
ncbi:UDP-N-acetylmuramate dehydrogenase [Aquimarina muelleri]|uniref:UDP-N-acetylenolpyruvoylglucosamine reductase n=1 Tax=Aquimarina muelleri TaxID=279356 RepID=A0A918JVF0_9FLAO|nr:UDP-N-acetylmuramate dehydrogenase [Aquimarina muelleri]MCX2762510.1 UDP-N-acetylmuramate dehydrogenase [Aquimarina muelleri]GGX20361.1 UDP-N-acetylenolpyruvoylglucosamine reductase [Aquimarina muelleri]